MPVALLMQLLRLGLGLGGGALATKGGSAIAKALFGGAAKKAGGLAASGLAKAGGTGVGQAIGRGAMATRGALPNFAKGAIPGSQSEMLGGLGRFLQNDIGRGALGIGGFLGTDALLNEFGAVFGGVPEQPMPAEAMAPIAPQNDELSSLIDVLSGDVESGNLDSPELAALLSALAPQNEQRRLI